MHVGIKGLSTGIAGRTLRLGSARLILAVPVWSVVCGPEEIDDVASEVACLELIGRTRSRRIGGDISLQTVIPSVERATRG